MKIKPKTIEVFQLTFYNNCYNLSTMNKEKTCDEMDFNEFNRWACEYVITEFLENGIKGIKRGMHMVLLQVVQNKEFGGGKSDKKNKKD